MQRLSNAIALTWEEYAILHAYRSNRIMTPLQQQTSNAWHRVITHLTCMHVGWHTPQGSWQSLLLPISHMALSLAVVVSQCRMLTLVV